jgi:NADH dehydrogenase
MKVLVIGGTSGATSAVVTALIARGHSVRLLSRRATLEGKAWASGVEPFQADVCDAVSITKCSEGCEAVLHLGGDRDEVEDIAGESLRALMEDAARAGVRRFVYASSHEEALDEAPAPSTAEAEAVVKTFPGEWLICRAFDVYGPSEGKLALLLKMVRTLPAVPVRLGGKRVSRPLWIEDFAQALTVAVEREAIAGQVIDLAGPEPVTEEALIEHLSRITDRSPAKLPIPEFIASLGERLGELLFGGSSSAASTDASGASGASTGGAAEGAASPPGEPVNALVNVLGIEPTPLATGLRKLADALPELLPSQGVGALKHKRFWTHIHGSALPAGDLFRRFCEQFGEILPIKVGVEPGTPLSLARGATLTLAMPIRGHIQVRVDEITDSSLTIVTLEGHPLAGAVRFAIEDGGGFVRAEVEVCDRAATRVDHLLMRAFGDVIQNANWKEVLKRIAALSGGAMRGGIRYEVEELGEEDAKRLEDHLQELVIKRKRELGDIDMVRSASPA